MPCGRVGVAIGLALTLAFGGCSFFFVDGPPPGERWPKHHFNAEDLEHCTSSLTAPVIDGAITLSLGAGGVYYATHHGGDGELNGIAAIEMLIVALPYFASALYGFAKTGECRTYLAGPPYPYPPEAGR